MLERVTLVHRPAAEPRRLALLAGSFNPPTRAHVALARAALETADAVLFVLPRSFPHKDWSGAALEDRLAMLQHVAATDPRLGVASSEGGLFVEMAREARQIWPAAEIDMVCGRDAAARIVEWDYGEPGEIERQLLVYGLLVADREGRYEAPGHLAHRVRPLSCAAMDAISSTEVRRRIASGEPWEELVPAEIVPLVRESYQSAPSHQRRHDIDQAG